jgi:hypothetical protein
VSAKLFCTCDGVVVDVEPEVALAGSCEDTDSPATASMARQAIDATAAMMLLFWVSRR